MFTKYQILKLSFRSDINFLRAIAVLLVILYHLNIKFFNGGWLGVDIFFFISGYLITNKILNSIQSNSFSFYNFFKNRFQRLTPSLISLSLTTTFFSFIFLSSAELKTHIDSTFYSLVYVSNFFYSNFDFYNAPNNKYLTMLHTWSLSVEEQIYILLPIILIFIYRRNKKFLVYGLISFFVCSLLLTIFSVSENIFYNTFSRVWEFFFGSLFMLFEKRIKEFGLKHSEIYGFTLILYSVIFVAGEDVNAIIPKILVLIGTALFMMECSEKRYITNKPIQVIGTISYSLYLFHQPVIAFLNIQNDKISELSNISEILIIFSIFIISYLNWYFIENGLRKEKNFILVLCVYFIIIITFGLLVFDIPDENKFFNVPNKIFLLKIKQDDILTQNGRSCHNRALRDSCSFINSEESTTIYVLGDSSLRTLGAALVNDPLFNKYNKVQVTGNDCLFIFGKHPSANSCPNKSIEDKDNFGMNIKDSIIIYGGRLPRYFSGEGFDNGFVKEQNDITVIPNLKNEIENTLKVFERNNNVIILIYPIPVQGWNIQELIFYKNYSKKSTIGYKSEVWDSRKQLSHEFLDSLNLPNLIRIYPDEIFCNTIVSGLCVGAHDGKVYFSDDDHLNLVGSNLLVKAIANNLP
jgi:peptidoglycan/LPS O-acetylase OafA/YrhL